MKRSDDIHTLRCLDRQTSILDYLMDGEDHLMDGEVINLLERHVVHGRASIMIGNREEDILYSTQLIVYMRN